MYSSKLANSLGDGGKKKRQNIGALTTKLIGSVPGWKITAQLYLRIAFLVREHNLYMTKSLIPAILQRSVAADASFKKLDGDKWWREVDVLLTKWHESAGATASSISA